MPGYPTEWDTLFAMMGAKRKENTVFLPIFEAGSKTDKYLSVWRFHSFFESCMLVVSGGLEHEVYESFLFT
jgi:hypothetical protein